MEDFEIKNSQIFKAILALTVENNIAIKAQNHFMLENIGNGRTEEENFNDFSSLVDQAKDEVLTRIFVLFGELGLGSVLDGK